MSQSPEIARRGIMLVVSSPSGAGKTTLTRNLLEQEESVSLSVSVTTREQVEKALAAGRDMLFDIDWQGTQQLYAKMRADVVSVFVLPPSATELKSRLERRAEDSGDTIKRRLRNAAQEIPHWNEYDYVLVNRDLDRSFTRLRAILTAERLKRVQKPDIEKFVSGLLGDLRQFDR